MAATRSWSVSMHSTRSSPPMYSGSCGVWSRRSPRANASKDTPECAGVCTDSRVCQCALRRRELGSVAETGDTPQSTAVSSSVRPWRRRLRPGGRAQTLPTPAHASTGPTRGRHVPGSARGGAAPHESQTTSGLGTGGLAGQHCAGRIGAPPDRSLAGCAAPDLWLPRGPDAHSRVSTHVRASNI